MVRTKLSEETRMKISLSLKEYHKIHTHWNKGKHRSLKTKVKISLSEKGKVISQEQREKLSKALKGKYVGKDSPNFGRKHSKKAKKKISEAAKRMWRENREKHVKSHSGKHNSRWQGGKRKTPDGYIQILDHKHPFGNCDGYVAEHRIVVEKQIGRYLKSTEPTHHIGKRDDNRPKMLMTFSSNSAHGRFHQNPKNVKVEEIIFDGRKLR